MAKQFKGSVAKATAPDKSKRSLNFNRTQRFRFPNSPEKVKLGTKLGDVWSAPNGDVYEIVEQYGGLVVLNKDTGGVSFIRTHNFSEYVLNESGQLEAAGLESMSRIARSAEEEL